VTQSGLSSRERRRDTAATSPQNQGREALPCAVQEHSPAAIAASHGLIVCLKTIFQKLKQEKVQVKSAAGVFEIRAVSFGFNQQNSVHDSRFFAETCQDAPTTASQNNDR
jgi:hypothetical protein